MPADAASTAGADTLAMLGDLHSFAILFSLFCDLLLQPLRAAPPASSRDRAGQGRAGQSRHWLQDNSGQRRCRCRLSFRRCRCRWQWPRRSRFRRTAELGVKFQTKVSWPGMAAAKTECECDSPTRSYPAGQPYTGQLCMK